MTRPTLLIVPGLRDHVEDHWQTHLARAVAKSRTVPPLEHDKLSRAARVDAVERTFQAIDGPVVIVAHSAGVMMVAHWAASFGHAVLGAVLAAPADVETPFPEGYPTRDSLAEHGWLPIPSGPLPFPSIVAASENDPLCRMERATQLAAFWGSTLVNIGQTGHLNPASGFGPWPGAEQLIQTFL